MRQQITPSWRDLGHMLVGGITGSGKSNFLKLLVIQAIEDGLKLYLIDDSTTFGVIQHHPQVEAYGCDLENPMPVVDAVLAEIKARAERFAGNGFIEDIDEYNLAHPDAQLKRVLFVVDEFNSFVEASGGTKSEFSRKVRRIAWMSRKFGVTLVIAGQTFHAEVAGLVRDQMKTKVCFRVKSAIVSRVILDEPGAELLPMPGVALTNFWGRIRVRKVKQEIWRSYARYVPKVKADDLSPEQKKIITMANDENGGQVTQRWLQSIGFSQKYATRLRHDLIDEGLAVQSHDGNRATTINLDDPRVIEILRNPRGGLPEASDA